MPRCFCGNELETHQKDMCTECQEVVADTLEDFGAPEGVIERLPPKLETAGIVMPKDKQPASVEEE